MGSAEPLHQFLGMELVCTWNAGPGTLAGDDTLLVCSGMGAAHYWADAAGRSLCAEWPAACESQVRPRNRGTGEGLGKAGFWSMVWTTCGVSSLEELVLLSWLWFIGCSVMQCHIACIALHAVPLALAEVLG